MKTTIKLLFVIAGIIYLILAYSCKTTKQQRRQNKCTAWGVCKTVSDSTVITKKDTVWLQATPVMVESDSGYFMAYLECNEQNNVIMTQYRTINGKYIALQNKLENGQLFVTASTPERVDTVYVPQYLTVKNVERAKVVEKITNELTTWQGFQIWLGRILLILILLYILYRLVRWILNKYTGGAFTFFSKRR